ncbi:uncharacterized protein ZBAI_02595 [Zygosaccharomyces bailii ISA1307]|uniref:ZYBA0S07-00760g1_1 n=1 Tax=Zygosaccharomyces bailii (strain CLIB 213 / ATCC 58445 / CBS 680 / BCRC 21525 / NBRC 1098 / NCYC 1416 / NRRL Y-2227) TaxID=1333698 RepID=A0A8J2T7M1_ZYGB2|nr:ZYBA0S07-00760g1_1 [Zygosaccharomyces bailii CLIB 213]CDH10809.1 uncharacterized protein ZBAI_02595 [Zygosaccharomyces bailii ISA1307]
MAKEQAIEYAITKIPDILPLEKSQVVALCEQILKTENKNADTIAEAFLDILGHSDLSFEFVIGFNSLLSLKEDTAGDQAQPKTRQKERTILPTEKKKPAPPPRAEISRNQKGHEKIKAKEKRTVKEKKTVKEQLLREINEVSKFLEQEPDQNNVRKFACNCQGNRHPLFEAAPNCLSCGKIVCIREGLHLSGCSDCGEEFISLEERLKILQLLQEEKNELENDTVKQERTEKQRTGKNKSGKSYKISTGIGTNLFTEQDKLFDLLERQKKREKRREEVLRTKQDIEKQEEQSRQVKEREETINPELAEAQERLDKLLHFQDTSAERTKIIDNVSDFSMASEGTLWGSARERALMLKKQQRNLRKWQKMESERNGRRDKYVVSMDIGRDGKVTLNEVQKDREGPVAHSDDDISDLSDEEDSKDLESIHLLKDEINADKKQANAKLESNVWDYERDKKQFKRPVYVGQENENVEKATQHEQIRKPRVQSDDSDEHFWERIA